MPHPLLKHVPNILTTLRMLLIPVLVVLLATPTPRSSCYAALTFFGASFSDWLDGYLARKWHITTPFGTLFDPLADKLLVATALIMLASLDRSPGVPAWMVVVIIAREFAVTGLRTVALSHNIIVAADTLGKYKMTCQVIALQMLILHYPFFGIDWHHIGLYFLWGALFLTVVSGLHYFVVLTPRIWREIAETT